MKIDDYVSGTAFIRLYRNHFKYEEDFENILKFLKQPERCGYIDLPVYENEVKGSFRNFPGTRHAKWSMYSSTMMECSSCKKHVPYHRYYYYCPQCGSKMEFADENV
jgi:NADH pyrophosphatase NudC (nudix superfamily)